ncbi:MAG: rhodanese-like domain-containing protein [Candidatus Heimdallarchaeota archaeon]
MKKIIKKTYLFVTMIILFLNISQVMSADYENISVEEAKSRLDSDPSIFLLDVRSSKEFADDGHINGSVNINVYYLYSNVHKLPENNKTGIIVYCDNGVRSKTGANKLVDIGYTNVSNMVEGFNEWVKKGYPFVFGTGTELTTSEVNLEIIGVIAIITITFRLYQNKRKTRDRRN